MTSSTILPGLVELFKKKTTKGRDTSAPESELDALIKETAMHFCSRLLGELNEIGSTVILGNKEGFIEGCWNALAERYRPLPDDTDQMRRLLFEQFQAWSQNPPFQLPDGELELNADGILSLRKTREIELPPIVELTPIRRGIVTKPGSLRF